MFYDQNQKYDYIDNDRYEDIDYLYENDLNQNLKREIKKKSEKMSKRIFHKKATKKSRNKINKKSNPIRKEQKTYKEDKE